ncbi:MAG: hypothetical protein ABEJ76_01185 [Halanaeroarchaeum sp.]
MDDVPADAPYVWIALLVVSAAVAGAVLAHPTAPPPDAERVAMAVDRVAATGHVASSTVPLDADRIRLGSTRIALESAGGRAYATVRYGPVAPVRDGDLARVLRGADPADVFASPATFRHALDRAESRRGTWRPAPTELSVRRVQYGEVAGVLVGR